jgi:hypothetical protein
VLHKIRNATAHHSEEGNATLQRSAAKEGDGSHLLLLLCVARKKKEEGDGNNRCLLPTVELRCNAAEEGDSVAELCYSAAQRRRRRQLPSPSSSIVLLFFFPL